MCIFALSVYLHNKNIYVNSYLSSIKITKIENKNNKNGEDFIPKFVYNSGKYF